MTRQHPCDDQGDGRPDAAALLCHLDSNAGKLVHKSIPDVAGACELEEPFGDLSGTDLEQVDKSLEQKLRNRDREEQK